MFFLGSRGAGGRLERVKSKDLKRKTALPLDATMEVVEKQEPSGILEEATATLQVGIRTLERENPSLRAITTGQKKRTEGASQE